MDPIQTSIKCLFACFRMRCLEQDKNTVYGSISFYILFFYYNLGHEKIRIESEMCYISHPEYFLEKGYSRTWFDKNSMSNVSFSRTLHSSSFLHLLNFNFQYTYLICEIHEIFLYTLVYKYVDQYYFLLHHSFMNESFYSFSYQCLDVQSCIF